MTYPNCTSPAALCETCGKHVVSCQIDRECVDTDERSLMRYRSARAAGLGHSAASSLAQQTGPMFYQPNGTE